MISRLKMIKILGLGPALRANRLRRFSQDLLPGFYTTRAVIALFNVGLIDELTQKGPVDLDSFAARNNLDLHVLRSLCDYLCSVCVMKRTGTAYALDQRYRPVIDTVTGPFYSVYAYQDIFRNLEALLKKEKTYGAEVTREPEFVARGSGAVGQYLAFPLMAHVLRRNGFKRVLDLCCGDATFLIDLCRRDHDVKGYGVDIAPEAIAFAQKRVEKRGLQDRISLVAGDVFHLDAVTGHVKDIEATTCVYALHEFLTDSQDRILDLLQRYRATFPGVPLVVCEVIHHTPEELRDKPGGVAEIQLWHDLSNQRLMSREEWHALFSRAGFATVHEDYAAVARTAIFTVS